MKTRKIVIIARKVQKLVASLVGATGRVDNFVDNMSISCLQPTTDL